MKVWIAVLMSDFVLAIIGAGGLPSLVASQSA